MSEKPVLRGWKEICNFLNCGKKVAKKYKEQGAPIINENGTISAIKSDLLAWYRQFFYEKEN